MKMYLYQTEGPKLKSHLRAMALADRAKTDILMRGARMNVVRDFVFTVLANKESFAALSKLDGYALWIGFAADAGLSDTVILTRKFYRNWVLPLEQVPQDQLVS